MRPATALASGRRTARAGRTHKSKTVRTLRFQKIIRAPLPFVFDGCTDFRDDDDRITDDVYHFEAKILLREPHRLIRVIAVPGGDRNLATEVEIIVPLPPDSWRLQKMSATVDKSGSYRLTSKAPGRTMIEMRFREVWRDRRPPSQLDYRALFNRVWDMYVETMERDVHEIQGGSA